MKKETLMQVREYLEERRIESLNYSEIETTDADPVMLDLARIVVEEKIRDLELKQSLGEIKAKIDGADISEIASEAVKK